MIFLDQWTASEITNARAFFDAHGRQLGTPNHPKDKIPEVHDLEFLVSSHNLGPGKTHIASNDSHFTENAQAIETSYNVAIVPMIQFDGVCNLLGWP
ncbi:MAG: hypothetical protein MUO81_07700 [Thermoplasmata archaeon]|nr:hypothetical protein [Thermoplasmata archaeon]